MTAQSYAVLIGTLLAGLGGIAFWAPKLYGKLLPEAVVEDTDEGLLDLRFKLTDVGRDAAGHRRLLLRARHQGTIVGLDVSVATDLRPGLTGETFDPSAVRHGGVVWRSAGAPVHCAGSAVCRRRRARS